MKDSVDTTDTTQFLGHTGIDGDDLKMAPKMASEVPGKKRNSSKKKKKIRRKTAQSNKGSMSKPGPEEDKTGTLVDANPMDGFKSEATSTFEMPCELNKGGEGDNMSEEEFENSDTEV